MRRRGFTIIEMMTVVGIASMLTLVVMSLVSYSRRKGEEAQLRANLRIVRAALDRCYADTGMLPAALSDLTSATVPAAGKLQTRAARITGTDYTNVSSSAFPAGTWRGPYLASVPQDPYTGATMCYTFAGSGCPSGSIVCGCSTDSSLDGSAFNTW